MINIDRQSNPIGEEEQIQVYLHQLNLLEKSDPEKFNEIMTSLEQHAKERASKQGIDLDEATASLLQQQNNQTRIKMPNDTENNSNGQLISPAPGFVIKTNIIFDDNHTHKSQTNKLCSKVFINVCTHKAIDIPRNKTKLMPDDSNKEISGMNVPVSVGPLRSCTDKKGDSAVAVDCIVNPTVLDFENPAADRDFICQLLIECVQSKYYNNKTSHNQRLSQKYKLPRIKYHSYLDPGKKVVADQWIRAQAPIIEDVSNSVSIPSERPKKLHQEAKDDSHLSSTLPNQKDSKNNASEKTRLPIQMQLILNDGTHVDIDHEMNENNKFYLSMIAPIAILNNNPNINDNFSINYPIVLCDSPKIQGKAVNQIKLSSQLPKIHDLTFAECFKRYKTNINLSLSTWRCFIEIKGFTKLNVNFPFCVDPQSATSELINDSEGKRMLFALIVNLARSDMENEADPGSRPWTFARGIEGNTKNHLRSNNNDDNTSNNKSLQIEQTEDESSLKTKIEEQQQVEDILPEDRFHASDVMSQCMLEKQRKERNDKLASKPSFNRSDEETEVLNVEDFRPGGKYYDEGLFSSTSTSSDGQLHIPKHCSQSRAHSEQIQKIPANANTSLDFASDLWSDLV